MLRARDIVELCDDLAIERASITVKEGWDHNAQFFLTFGPLAYRQLLEIDPNSDLDAVKLKLECMTGEIWAKYLREAPTPPVVIAKVCPKCGISPTECHCQQWPAQEAKPSPAATPAPAKGKRKKVGNAG